MSDIVERLRDDQPGERQCVREARMDLGCLLMEAADEIEKLRAALRQIGKDDTCVALLSHPPICSRAFAARAALGEKE